MSRPGDFAAMVITRGFAGRRQWVSDGLIHPLMQGGILMPAIQAMRRVAVLATATAALAFGTFVSSSAQAAAPSAVPTAPTATSGIPALVDPAVDLGRHAPGPQLTWFDSIYFTSLVRANGQEFGLQVHTRILPNRDEAAYRWTFSVINKTTGWYKDYEAMVEPEDYRWSEGKLGTRAELDG
jgi:hypothetical protein